MFDNVFFFLLLVVSCNQFYFKNSIKSVKRLKSLQFTHAIQTLNLVFNAMILSLTTNVVVTFPCNYLVASLSLPRVGSKPISRISVPHGSFIRVL